MKVFLSKNFEKQFSRLTRNIRDHFFKRVDLFIREPTHQQLNVHKLSGKYEGLWSINITGNIRAVIDRSQKDIALFVAIGSHSELYV